MRDEFDDIIDEIKKYFKLDSDKFDVDFLFIPESESNINLKPIDKKIKGFKISYHFETGMEKPEIKIEGNIDDKRIREYLKNIDLSNYPKLKNLFETKYKEEIDANMLSLDFSEQNMDQSILEPHTEVNDYTDFIEIVLDIPGMSEEDVMIDIIEGGTKLIFNAENRNRSYMKSVRLPFKSSAELFEMEVKNGLAIIKVRKLDK
ncbi:MAG: Hsp20/alpha crystallin family protein [Promethearchaeota archaeon]